MEETKQLPLDRWPQFSRKLPYGKVRTGYMVSPDNPLILVPNPEEVAYLEKGFDYLDAGSSLREVCEWVGQKINKPIVHMTISNLYKMHRKPYLKTKTRRRQGRKHTRDAKKVIQAKALARSAVAKAVKIEKEVEAKKGRLKKEDYDRPPQPSDYVAPKGLDRIAPVPSEVKFAFKPNPGPQWDFLAASEFQVLYGGAAGGKPKISGFNYRLLSQ